MQTLFALMRSHHSRHSSKGCAMNVYFIVLKDDLTDTEQHVFMLADTPREALIKAQDTKYIQSFGITFTHVRTTKLKDAQSIPEQLSEKLAIEDHFERKRRLPVGDSGFRVADLVQYRHGFYRVYDSEAVGSKTKAVLLHVSYRFFLRNVSWKSLKLFELNKLVKEITLRTKQERRPCVTTQ